MFHISNLGGFGRSLRQYTDLGGYVPQPGDQPEQFHWACPTAEWTADDWADFVRQAEAETDAAEAALGQWQNQRPEVLPISRTALVTARP